MGFQNSTLTICRPPLGYGQSGLAVRWSVLGGIDYCANPEARVCEAQVASCEPASASLQVRLYGVSQCESIK